MIHLFYVHINLFLRTIIHIKHIINNTRLNFNLGTYIKNIIDFHLKNISLNHH